MNSQPVHVLLAEDNLIDVEGVRRAFDKQKANCTLHVASDGEKAFELLSDLRSRGLEHVVVLLDLNMPRMDGLEFLTALRADDALKYTVVFVVSTSSADEDVLRSYALSVAGYIVKSASPRRFLDLAELIERYWQVVRLPPAEAGH